MANEEVPAYIARCKCGAIIMATVDKPELSEDNAKEIAACIRQGYVIERTTVGHVREMDWMDCTCNSEATRKFPRAETPTARKDKQKQFCLPLEQD